MRPFTALTLTTALALAAPAFAQQAAPARPGADQASSASETLNPTTGAGAPPVPSASTASAPVGNKSDVNATSPVVPSDWGGDAKSWAAHTAACTKAYGNYDASNDMFTTPSGRPQKCMLAMGKAGKR
jgi:hypothetical protein